MMKQFPILAIKKNVRVADAVADDEMVRELTMVKRRQNLGQSTMTAIRKMMIPAISLARTVGFHPGKKRSELWLP